MIFAYDHRGIIMTDRVPRGTSVTAAYEYYRDWIQTLRRKIHKTDLTCSWMGHSFCTTMHAPTGGRLWPIWWVNTSGKCYLTRHTVQTWVHRTSKLKEPVRGHRFSSLEEVSAAVTRAIRGLNKSGTLKWNSKSSETLGRGHWEAGGLHRRNVKEILPKI